MRAHESSRQLEPVLVGQVHIDQRGLGPQLVDVLNPLCRRGRLGDDPVAPPYQQIGQQPPKQRGVIDDNHPGRSLMEQPAGH
jgi:hypothetical protein